MFTRFRFTEGGLKFNFWSLDPDYALLGGILSCLRWDLPRSRPYLFTEFEVSSFTHSKDTAHVPLNGWMRKGVCPNSRVDLRRYLSDPHQIWHQYSRMVSALR